jgi:hypothetical protein
MKIMKTHKKGGIVGLEIVEARKPADNCSKQHKLLAEAGLG